MRPELVIAEKEFRDHIVSKRFLVILALLLLIAAYAMATGIDQYNKNLEQYKKDVSTGESRYQDAVRFQQGNIDRAVESGTPAEQIEFMKRDLETLKVSMGYFLNPKMPSLLQVFQPYSLLLGFLGMVLGIAMGFDQITKEKKSGSLKSVLSAPVYRDSLINGKAIGSMASLAAAVGIMFLVTIAIMLFYGVVPGLDDLLRIGLFFIASILYCTAFFAIAILTSAVSRNSAMAVILAIGIVFTLLIISFASSIGAYFIAGAVMEPAPEPVYNTPVYTVGTGELNSTVPVATPAPSPTSDYYNKKGKLQMQISDILNIISPPYDYMGMGSIYPGIGQALLSREKPTDYYTVVYTPYSLPAQVSLLDSLSYVWIKVLALLVETLLAFALSYVIFMRMDVR